MFLLEKSMDFLINIYPPPAKKTYLLSRVSYYRHRVNIYLESSSPLGRHVVQHVCFQGFSGSRLLEADGLECPRNQRIDFIPKRWYTFRCAPLRLLPWKPAISSTSPRLYFITHKISLSKCFLKSFFQLFFLPPVPDKRIQSQGRTTDDRKDLAPNISAIVCFAPRFHSRDYLFKTLFL